MPKGRYVWLSRAEDYGWAEVSNRSNVIGHEAKHSILAGWHFQMSETDG